MTAVRFKIKSTQAVVDMVRLVRSMVDHGHGQIRNGIGPTADTSQLQVAFTANSQFNVSDAPFT